MDAPFIPISIILTLPAIFSTESEMFLYVHNKECTFYQMKVSGKLVLEHLMFFAFWKCSNISQISSNYIYCLPFLLFIFCSLSSTKDTFSRLLLSEYITYD